jgi:hypothetical protein
MSCRLPTDDCKTTPGWVAAPERPVFQSSIDNRQSHAVYPLARAALQPLHVPSKIHYAMSYLACQYFYNYLGSSPAKRQVTPVGGGFGSRRRRDKSPEANVAQGPLFGPFAPLRACPERSECGRLCGSSRLSRRRRAACSNARKTLEEPKGPAFWPSVRGAFCDDASLPVAHARKTKKNLRLVPLSFLVSYPLNVCRTCSTIFGNRSKTL